MLLSATTSDSSHSKLSSNMTQITGWNLEIILLISQVNKICFQDYMTTFSCKNEAIYLKWIPMISIVIQNVVFEYVH